MKDKRGKRNREALTPGILGICIPTSNKRLLDLFPTGIPINKACAVLAKANGVISSPADSAPCYRCDEADDSEDVSRRPPLGSRGSCRARVPFPGGVAGAFGAPVAHLAGLGRCGFADKEAFRPWRLRTRLTCTGVEESYGIRGVRRPASMSRGEMENFNSSIPIAIYAV